MDRGIQVDPDWVARHLDDPMVRLVEVDVSPAAYAEGHIPGAVFWDAYRDLRHPDHTPIDPASGAGEGAGRPGRLPGAVHVPVELAREQDGSLADGEALRRACEERGVEPGRRVVVYCTIGNRASQVGFALKHQLGYPDVAVYYGSWSEWGSSAETPIET